MRRISSANFIQFHLRRRVDRRLLAELECRQAVLRILVRKGHDKVDVVTVDNGAHEVGSTDIIPGQFIKRRKW